MVSEHRKSYLRAYQRRWIAARRAEFFKDKFCAVCGETTGLELDHIDRNGKVDHKIWSWSWPRISAEVNKCQILCSSHHQAKTNAENKAADVWKELRKIGPDGTEWCNGHKAFVQSDRFSPKLIRWNGVHEYCRQCRNDGRKVGKQL